MDLRPIGLLDSGVGGLSVLQEVKRLLPYESIIYYADTANMPYGIKEDEEITSRITAIIALLQKRKVKLVVVACNTGTVAGITLFREQFPDLPIVGVVPVVRTVAQLTKTNAIGILATKATLSSAALKELEERYARGLTVVHQYPEGLVEQIEAGNVADRQTTAIIKKAIAPMIAANVGAIALGCTHYVFVKDEIERLCGPDIFVLDSGAAVTRQVWRVLLSNQHLAHDKDDAATQKPFYQFLVSGKPENFRLAAGALLGKQFVKEVEHFPYVLDSYAKRKG